MCVKNMWVDNMWMGNKKGGKHVGGKQVGGKHVGGYKQISTFAVIFVYCSIFYLYLCIVQFSIIRVYFVLSLYYI